MGGIFKVLQVFITKDGFYEVTFGHSDYSSITGFTFITQLDIFKVGDKYTLVSETPQSNVL